MDAFGKALFTLSREFNGAQRSQCTFRCLPNPQAVILSRQLLEGFLGRACQTQILPMQEILQWLNSPFSYKGSRVHRCLRQFIRERNGLDILDACDLAQNDLPCLPGRGLRGRLEAPGRWEAMKQGRPSMREEFRRDILNVLGVYQYPATASTAMTISEPPYGMIQLLRTCRQASPAVVNFEPGSDIPTTALGSAGAICPAFSPSSGT